MKIRLRYNNDMGDWDGEFACRFYLYDEALMKAHQQGENVFEAHERLFKTYWEGQNE